LNYRAGQIEAVPKGEILALLISIFYLKNKKNSAGVSSWHGNPAIQGLDNFQGDKQTGNDLSRR
jgi:hypothetical protein